MAADRKEAERTRRKFRPALDGNLETRTLLSTAGLWTRAGADIDTARQARLDNFAAQSAAQSLQSTQVRLQQQRLTPQLQRLSPLQQRAWRPGSFQTFTFNGGKGVRIIDPQGEAFNVHAVGTGTVWAVPLHNGTIRIVVDGSTPSTELLIDPVTPRANAQAGLAHTFLGSFGRGDEILPVGQIDVLSGRIGSISGFRTVDLHGPINILDSYANPNDGPVVERIALNAMLPGSSIHVANDLNTLDVFTSAELIGEGSGIFVGRDFNWSNVRGDLKLGEGGQIVVGRDFGRVGQPAKGTGSAGQGLLVGGDTLIGGGSFFTINRNLSGPIVVIGDFLGTGQIVINGAVAGGSLTVLGEATVAPAPVVVPTVPPPLRR